MDVKETTMVEVKIPKALTERALGLLPPGTTLDVALATLLAQWIQQEAARRLQAELAKELGPG